MELCVYMGNRKIILKTRLLKKDWLIFSSGHYCLIIIICFLKKLKMAELLNLQKRIGNGFTKYVNIKNDRSGYLFQNKAKIILAEGDAHFLYLPFYVDANPIEIIYHNWKEEGVRNNDLEKAITFLKSYKWSSFSDYAGVNNFPDIINKDSFLNYMKPTKVII